MEVSWGEKGVNVRLLILTEKYFKCLIELCLKSTKKIILTVTHTPTVMPMVITMLTEPLSGE